jgi:hypothetical protein
MSTAVSTVCPLSIRTSQCTVLRQYVQICVPQSVHCLSVLHIVPSVGSVSLCPQLNSALFPLSVSSSHCTVLWHSIVCCLLQSLQCLSVPHNVLCVCSVSPCPLLYSTLCPMSVTTSQCTVLCHYVHCCLVQSDHCLSVLHNVYFCVTMSTALFYSMSNVCQFLTNYCSVSLCPLLSRRIGPLSLGTSQCSVLCHYVHCCLLQSVHCLPVLHILPSVGSVLCHHVRSCVLQSVQYLSLPHTAPFVGSVSPCPLLSSTVCPMSVSTSHCTVFWFCVIMSTALLYNLSNFFHYLTVYRLLVPCHYVHICLL